MDVDGLVRQVKRNCDISDARFWGDYSICGLLMRLRELYLHEHGLMPWDRIREQDVTAWIQQREQGWRELESAQMNPLHFESEIFDPFEAEGINCRLVPEGLVYGSGYGTMQKPVFFLARLISIEEVLDYEVYISGRELCRDLSASPAMLQGRCIHIRTDSIRSILWDRLQNLRGRKFPGAQGEMFSVFHIRGDEEDGPLLFQKIGEMIPAVARLLILHETGEAFEDDRADEWLEMLRQCNDKTVELYARAVKDLLADMSLQGPFHFMIETKDEGLLRIHFALLDGIRRELFPDLMRAYQDFLQEGDWSVLKNVRDACYGRATRLRDGLLSVWEEQHGRPEAAEVMRRYLKSGA